MIAHQRKLGIVIVSYVVLIVLALITILPLIWLLYTSFKPHKEIIENVFALPRVFSMDNYQRTWEFGRFGIASFNSIFYSTVATLLTTLLALMTGYGFAKFGYKRLSGFLYYFFILGLLITVHSVLVPLFIMESFLNLDDTRLGILLPYIAFGLPFLVYLSTSYIRTIPTALEEAALIDGASYIRVFWSIIVPMSRPVIGTMLIFSFLSNWNEFVFVFTLTSKATLRSLPVAVNAFAGGMARDFGLLFSALTIATIPMIVFYFVFRKKIAQGFAAGSIKE